MPKQGNSLDAKWMTAKKPTMERPNNWMGKDKFCSSQETKLFPVSLLSYYQELGLCKVAKEMKTWLLLGSYRAWPQVALWQV